MAQSEADRLLLAWVQGIVARRVGYRELTAQQRAEAIEEIRSVTKRVDLLAEVAGIRRGLAPYKVPPQEVERYERQAELLIAAGADVSLILQWAEIGRRRGKEAEAIPYTGQRHR